MATTLPPVLQRPVRVARAIVRRPLSALDDLGAQLSFYARSLFWTYRELIRYKREVIRLLAEVSLGSGVSTSEPVSGTFTSTCEGALLGGLLGGAGDVGVAAAHSSGLAHLERARHVPAAGRRRNLHDRERLTHYR